MLIVVSTCTALKVAWHVQAHKWGIPSVKAIFILYCPPVGEAGDIVTSSSVRLTIRVCVCVRVYVSFISTGCMYHEYER